MDHKGVMKLHEVYENSKQLILVLDLYQGGEL